MRVAEPSLALLVIVCPEEKKAAWIWDLVDPTMRCGKRPVRVKVAEHATPGTLEVLSERAPQARRAAAVVFKRRKSTSDLNSLDKDILHRMVLVHQVG
jgi:hypothetical protein